MKSIPVTLTTPDFTRKIYVKSREEYDFWKQVGKYILKVKTLPSTMYVEAKIDGKVYNAEMHLMHRGDVALPDGTKVPSLHINSAFSNILLDENKKYEEMELRCINTSGNNYKKYFLEPRPDGIYGRYGGIDIPKDQCRVIKNPYERWLFWPLYYEKLSKGYKDVTDITMSGTAVTKTSSSRKRTSRSGVTVNERMYAQFYEYAHGVVKKNLVSEIVTQEQVDKSEAILDKMRRCRKVETFNKQYEELMLLSPRKRDWKTDKIGDYLAKSKDDFPKILDFEENLITAMQGVVIATQHRESFKDYNIHFWEATDTQKQEVMGLIEQPSIRSMVKHVYRVKPEKQEKALSAYCKKNGVKEKRKFFHGTVNGNMLSLIINGPDIARTAANGRMWGDAFYTAKSAHKSWNYTSCRGTSWARGTESKGYLLIYTCAYGNPYKPSTRGGKHYSQSYLRSMGYHCVHAEAARTGLRADEIMFYDKDAVCLSYVVELAC